ncbi:MAG TPA: glutamine synthetase family protein [Clostridia bacterium]|nr:glutamine synthetase family protein [Clostridia bacterium]HOL60871.1 glutamine synthetase family protein [Clostridia bacterium]HPO53623.1 glutamine synthetase family protein [Clostridia bacterium]
MDATASEVLNFIQENDVKFIRLGFCDLFGQQKNMSIMPGELENAFQRGITFDASAIKGFSDVTKSDLFLFPDPATLRVLPWRPGPGRVVRFFCDIRNPDGTPFERDTRQILKNVVEKCGRRGFVCKIGPECEFYLFKTGPDGEPTLDPIDFGGYLDINPLDKGENIRRELCLCLDEMGIRIEHSHHEQGPGQNEIDFKYGDALESADNMLTFKSVVKAVAARNGLFASFMPKPFADKPGSGLHVNISLARNGFNAFGNEEQSLSEVAKSFIEGIMRRIPEITLFLNPICNSYERFGSFEAPKYVSWSHQNRSQLIRIPAAAGERMRMELRSPDPSVNPYLAFALIISAGLEGIEDNIPLRRPIDQNLFKAGEGVTDALERLPRSIEEAITLAEHSEFAEAVLGKDLVARFIESKKEEAKEYAEAEDKAAFGFKRYFKVI